MNSKKYKIGSKFYSTINREATLDNTYRWETLIEATITLKNDKPVVNFLDGNIYFCKVAFRNGELLPNVIEIKTETEAIEHALDVEAELTKKLLDVQISIKENTLKALEE